MGMKWLHRVTIGAAALMTASGVGAQVAVDVSVDTTKAGPKIERTIYGQFAEHLGRGIYEGIWVGSDSDIPNINGYRKDVIEALRKIKVPVIR